jgi:hypothetical protein
MMKLKVVAVAVALPLMTAGTLAVATPHADAAKPRRNSTPKCITKKEFRKIHKNQSISRVRQIVGARGKITSDSSFSDGDRYTSVDFRQCGGGYGSATISFENTERTTYVPDVQCDDWDGDGYEEDCTDWGSDETTYSAPLIVTSKSAWWS